MNIEGSDIQNILIVARGGIGNVLMFTPTLRALKKRFPNSEIYVMVFSKETYELLLNSSDIKKVIVYEGRIHGLLSLFRFTTMLRKKHFDLAIVMHPGGLRSAILAFISGAKIRIGYDMRLLRGLGPFLYTNLLQPDSSLHDLEQNLNILELFGVNPKIAPKIMTIDIPDKIKQSALEYLACHGYKDGDKIIGFHPGSSQEWKRWPGQYFSELINMIASEWNTSMIIFGSHHESTLINEIISKVKSTVRVKDITNMILMECAALIGLCHAFIGNDSGLTHIAAARGIPTFCIAGPTKIKKTRPYGPNSHIIHLNLECLFCYDYNTINFKCSKKLAFKCLKDLYPEEVFRQIQSILSQVLN